MSTTVENLSLAELLKDGNKIICQRGVCLLIRLKPQDRHSNDSKTLIWNTKTEEVIGSGEGYRGLELVHGNIYYKVDEHELYGILNTKTGQLWASPTYRQIEHVYDHYFAIKKNEAYYLLDVNTGKELKYREVKDSDGRFILKKTIEHTVGPYFLVSGHLLNVKTGECRTDGYYDHVHGHHFIFRKDGATHLLDVRTGKSQKFDLCTMHFQHMRGSIFLCGGFKKLGDRHQVKPFILNFKNGKTTKIA